MIPLCRNRVRYWWVVVSISRFIVLFFTVIFWLNTLQIWSEEQHRLCMDLWLSFNASSNFFETGILSLQNQVCPSQLQLWELFKSIPVDTKILRGSIKADLIGFHTFDYAQNFMSCYSRMFSLDKKVVDGRSHFTSSRPSLWPIDLFCHMLLPFSIRGSLYWRRE